MYSKSTFYWRNKNLLKTREKKPTPVLEFLRLLEND